MRPESEDWRRGVSASREGLTLCMLICFSHSSIFSFRPVFAFSRASRARLNELYRLTTEYRA